MSPEISTKSEIVEFIHHGLAIANQLIWLSLYQIMDVILQKSTPLFRKIICCNLETE